MVFAGNFEYCGKGIYEGVHLIPDPLRNLPVTLKSAHVQVHSSDFSIIGACPPCGVADHRARIRPSDLRHGRWGGQTYVLVDQDYANILSLFRECCKCPFYLRRFSLMINYKEVPLRPRWLGDVADACEQ
jgi:hypothetical protein